jgi:hypothetical protein
VFFGILRFAQDDSKNEQRQMQMRGFFASLRMTAETCKCKCNGNSKGNSDRYGMTTGEQATAIAKTATAAATAASSGLENDEDQQVVGRVRWVRVRACMQLRR